MSISISLILKVAGIGILVQILNTILETSDKSDYSTLVNLGGIVVVLGMVTPEIHLVIKTVSSIFNLQ